MNLYQSNKFLFVAGPCALESERTCQAVAEVLWQLQKEHSDVATIIFKTSFDKANRTDVKSRRGLGIDACLNVFTEIQARYDLKTTTDIHLPEQAARVAPVCDVIQIPAFLCRQTDLLLAAAETGRTVNVKKGQFLSPFDVQFIIKKLQQGQAKEIWITERGTTFGYGNLVVDMRAFPMISQMGCPILLDATHCLQMPGMGKSTTQGDRQYAKPLALAALAAGANGIWLETHPSPENAWSDQATQIPLEQLPEIFLSCLKLWQYLHHS